MGEKPCWHFVRPKNVTEAELCITIARLILAIAKVMQASPSSRSRYSETNARYSELGTGVQVGSGLWVKSLQRDFFLIGLLLGVLSTVLGLYIGVSLNTKTR